MKRFLPWLVILALSLGARTHLSALDASTLTEVGLNLGSHPYYSHPAFANSLWNGSGWLEYAEGAFGEPVFFEDNPQFTPEGYPKFLNPNRKLRALVFGLHANQEPRPPTWPDRTQLARGKVVITWQGDADVRANSGVYLAAESSGAATGSLSNGRRVYRFSDAQRLEWITVEAVNPASPITDLKVWLPDPGDPDNRALENQLFHPTYLARLSDAPWAFLRFMDWNASNASPQQDWANRRLPRHIFQQGVLSRRPPAAGFGGDRETGVAFEHMIALCNTNQRDMWISVPHLATDDFIVKLAQLLQFGSDGVNPYTNTVAAPVYPPLDAGRRVFVEYSNEIWSGGNSFAQGHWAEDQASVLGISKARFNARRFCQVWNLFQSVFGPASARVIRVAAVFTGVQAYTDDFLNEIAAFGAALSPPQTADIISPTTYFGNGIQDWAYAKAQQQAGTTDPWFFSTNTFTDGDRTKPVSLPASAPYWTSAKVGQHLAETFVEWKRRMLSGATQSGGGPDATGVGGGFEAWLRTSSSNAFGVLKPLVSYEGGPSLYTDYLDGGDERDDGITMFLELLNRQPQFSEVYRIHLNLAKAKGLRTHGAFVDVGVWGKYGQWGHLEYLDQDPNQSAKWNFLRQWPAEMAGLRPVDDPLGAQPVFAVPAKLPAAVFARPYDQEITVSNGNGVLTLNLIDQLVTAGLSVTNFSEGPARLRISGTPTEAGENYLLVRGRDADGDPVWRTFFFKTLGGPGTLLETSFQGANPAQNLPWTAADVLDPGLTFSGWTRGAGIIPAAGADALVWSQSMPPAQVDSTLARALADDEFWQFTLTPAVAKPLDLRGAEVRFTIRRVDFHSPREYAVFTSLDGFANNAPVFTTGHLGDDTSAREFVFNLPATTAYASVTTTVTFRIYGYFGQFDGHRTSLAGFKLTQSKPELEPLIVSDPKLSLDGAFGFQIRGPAGRLFAVELSDDLVTWTPLAAVPSASGSAFFSDPTATNRPTRFYRVGLR